MSLPSLQARTLNGVQIRFVDAGVGDPPLVFVHGWGCSHRSFAPQLEHFGARHRVVGPDQRGHGQSEAPHDEIRVERLADDLLELCRELALDRPVLVGHSLGACVAVEAAARQPGLARGVALVDPALLFHERAASRLADFVDQLTRHEWRQSVRSFAERVFFRQGDASELRGQIVEDILQTPRRVLHTAFRSMLAFDAEPALSRLRVPLLLLDPPRPVGDRERLRAVRPDLVEVVVPDVGHFLQLEAPEAVAAALERFVARC